MKYKAIVWDLDGTLLDTLQDLTNSVNYALKNNAYTPKTKAEVCQSVGNGILRLMERVVPDGQNAPDFAKVFQDFKTNYGAHCEDNTDMYPGIGLFLQKANSAGIGMAIVSNKADFAVKKLAEKYFPDTIPIAIGENEAAGIRKKPAPDTVFKALELLGVKTSDAVYIGDSEVDIATAANAGMDCISVTWGFRTVQVLVANGASVLIDTPEQLWDYLTQS